MIVLATVASSPSETHSSTACASSIPGVPTITAGMPRAVKRRMSAPQGTPVSGGRAPSSSRRAPRTIADPRVSGGVSPGANAPPSQPARSGDSPSSSAGHRLQRGPGRVQVGAERHAEAALELDAVGHLARPLAAGDPPDEQRIGQLSARISGMRRRRG